MKTGLALGAAGVVALVASPPLGVGPDRAPTRPGESARSRWQRLEQPAPDAGFRRLQGSVLRLRDLRGQVVLVDYWTTWCKPCVEEMPDLVAFDAWARQRGDVVLLSVNEDSDAGALARFLGRHRPAFTVLRPGSEDAFAVTSYPTKVFLDRAGVVRFRRAGGPVASSELRALALELLRP
jgi:thiol-disulfide isomerase/thioredoxin